MSDATVFAGEFQPLLPYLGTVARGLTRSQEDAEDLTQETMLSLWRAVGRYTPGTNATGFALRIMRNLAVSHFRSKEQQKSYTYVEDWDCTDSAMSPEDVYLQKEFLDEVEDALQDLDPDLQRVFTSITVHKHTYDEAAVLLDVPRGTASSRQHRAKVQMREALARREQTQPV